MKLLRLFTSVAIAIFLLFIPCVIQAQSCVLTGLNNTVISSACNQVCRDLIFQIPDLRSSSDYQVVSIPYNPYPYVTPLGTEDVRLYDDDAYSNVFSLPFPFCFYDNVYTKAVVSSNGLVTFDTAYALCPAGGAAWDIVSTIPYNGGGGNCTPSHYPRASIMAAFMDLDPRPGPTSGIISSPPERKIEWRVEGVAPCRRFVVSYYHIGVYQQTVCGLTTPATFQIVMYESTGLIDVFFENKICVANGTNGAFSILGVQDFTRLLARAAPNKNRTIWSASNEGYRFVPFGGSSRFVSSEILTIGLSHIAWATTSTPTPGLLDLNFPNICATPPSTQYIVRTIYAACENPVTLLTSLDTITVNVASNFNPTASTTAASCGPPDGTITVTVPPGAGTPPYTFVLDGVTTVIAPSPYMFMNVAAGTHTVVVTDFSGGCTSTINNITVIQNTVITANAVPTATSCSGANNGQILVTPNGGTAPYTFLLNPGAITQTGNTALFTGLAAGSYTVMVNDAGSCFISSPISVTVVAGPVLTTTANVTDVLCNGGATGTITVVQPAMGTAPFEYSLNGGLWQSSPIFPGLAAGTYTVGYRESNGCQGSHQETVNEPAAMNSSATTTAAICNGQNNGTITVIAGGGVAPYEYSIDGGLNWQSNNVFTKGAGVYTIIIRDANNCTVPQIATVTEPAMLTAAAVNNNASCDGGNDGLITITANGGNGGFQYSIDGGPFQALNTFNAAPGTYTITVKDNLGCSATFNTVVGLTSNLTFTPQTDPFICEGTSTQLQLNSNATIYSWTPATGLSNTTISNPVANPMVTTQYTVTATLGRCSANDIVIVNVNAAPIPDAGPDGFICYGQTYQLQGSGAVQYTWTPSTNLSSTTISNPVSSPVKTITYTLSQVIDAIGCKSLTTDQVTVDVTPPIKVKTFPYDTIGYPGDQFQLNATSAATFYSWSPATGLSNPNIPNPVLTVGPLGSDVLYQVIASTAAGCRGEGYVNLKVYKGPELYVPNAFTPNGDGLNDLFYPFPVGIKSINYFKVFNRWGQLLFSSTTLYKGWDGKLRGVEQPSGVYAFMAQGVDKNDKLLTRQGTVMLIR
jgi:gliding motility-associated-like protein